MSRIISELRPRIAVLENVPAITIRGLDKVLCSLASMGYDAEWTHLSAQTFGAPHKRNRWFLIAYTNGITKTIYKKKNESYQVREAKKRLIYKAQSKRIGENIHNSRFNSLLGALHRIHRKNYWNRIENPSPICHLDDGIPDRLARLKALGNAVVPQCAQYIGEAIVNSGLIDDLIPQPQENK